MLSLLGELLMLQRVRLAAGTALAEEFVAWDRHKRLTWRAKQRPGQLELVREILCGKVGE